MRKTLFQAGTLLSLVLLPAASVLGQAVYGGIVGTVTDSSGAAVPKANVTIADTGKGVSFNTTTNESGNYSQTHLIAGLYEVRVEASAAPTVNIDNVTPASPVAGQPVSFTVSTTSGNTSAARQVQTLEVNFGDGTSEVRSNVTGTTAFTHTYQREGGYTITARAVDVAGNTGVTSRAILVARQQLPTVSITAPATATTTTPVSITTTAGTTATNAQITNVRVTLQDGTVIYNGSSAGSFNYLFSTAGTYTLTAVATDSNGNTATAQTQTKVN